MMNSPVGAFFYFDVLYGTSKGQVTAGDFFARDFNRFYSSEYIDGEKLGDGDNSQTVFAATLKFTPIKNVVGLVSGEMLKIVHIDSTVTPSTVYTGYADAAGAITGTNIASGSVNFTTGAITVTFTNAPDDATEVLCYYEYISEANAQVPQMNMQIVMQEVKALPRKLKALTSSEALEDLMALHGVDGNSEILTHAADEIALEIDREIIQEVMAGAAGGTAAWDRSVPTGISELDHFRSILTPISNVSNAIHKGTLRSPANWLVVSPEVASILEQFFTHADYRPNVYPSEPNIPMPQGQFGVFPMGVLLNRWMVYRDPYLTPINKILVGLKGKSIMDAGYAWGPYVPLQVTGTFLDPNDQVVKQGFRTRYAKKMLRPEYYGTVTIQNF